MRLDAVVSSSAAAASVPSGCARDGDGATHTPSGNKLILVQGTSQPFGTNLLLGGDGPKRESCAEPLLSGVSSVTAPWMKVLPQNLPGLSPFGCK